MWFKASVATAWSCCYPSATMNIGYWMLREALIALGAIEPGAAGGSESPSRRQALTAHDSAAKEAFAS